MVSLTRILGIHTDDPVDLATSWSARNNNTRVAFICAANEKRPGGDWETGVVGYEERLCRRSTLSATIATPGPASYVTGSHYPLPWAGGIYSDRVGKSKKAPLVTLQTERGIHWPPFFANICCLRTGQSSSAAHTTGTRSASWRSGGRCRWCR